MKWSWFTSVLVAVVLGACSGDEPYVGPAGYRGPQMAEELADLVVVNKQARRLVLYSKGWAIASYPIALGPKPEGHKAAEGDGRTPEGLYMIDRRNPNSRYHLSLGISYPNARDMARAAEAGVEPGGEIFIHGHPNGSDRAVRLVNDWTNGCIAVSNAEIEEIWSRVPTGTPIEIRP